MTKIRNEVASATRTAWQANFNAESNNIYDSFQTNKIVLSKIIYDKLKFDFNCHIRIYFGLTAGGAPTVIALPAYKLDELDSESMDRQWDNIYKEDCIYELYGNKLISIADAKTQITIWNTKSSDELFLNGFIIPRSNLIDIFENQKMDYALLDFGIRKEIKLMTTPSNSSGTPISGLPTGDNCLPCPPYCAKIGFFDL